jgi:hypothetical protein
MDTGTLAKQHLLDILNRLTLFDLEYATGLPQDKCKRIMNFRDLLMKEKEDANKR